MLRRSGFLCILLIFLVSVPASAGSILIWYSVTGLGGSDYKYTYWVFNNGSLGPGVSGPAL